MAHMLEKIDGKYCMAYAGETPWHGLGTKVPGDLTPEQMLKAAGLDWEVEKVPTYFHYGNKRIKTGDSALVRKTDGHLLTTVSDNWNSVQNKVAAQFFDGMVAEADASMETAGSIDDGRKVWMLAKIKSESFDMFKGKDVIEPYWLFVNPHLYGWSTSVSLTAIQVVCNNTLNLSLNSTKSDKIIRVNHRREFVVEEVQQMLGVTREKMRLYKESAKFIASKKANKEDIVEYFKRLFPVVTSKEDSKKEMSKTANIALDIMDQMPGANLGTGTWWQPYNAVTFTVDHLAGRSDNSRLNSAWFGEGRKKKVKALEAAVEMANAS